LSYCFCLFHAAGSIIPIVLGSEISRNENQIAYKPCVRDSQMNDPIKAFFDKMDKFKEQWLKVK
jgi:hypothetical protein